MTTLVIGGSKSGKSRVAETIVTAADLPLYYIATMTPFGQEARQAIERHRAMREGKGFATVEQYTDIEKSPIPDRCAALLECMGNLCANEMFSACAPQPAEKILAGINALQKRCAVLVIVTNDVGRDGIAYDSETSRYIRTLGAINSSLARGADCVIETVCGIPLVLKGEKPPCLSGFPC